MKAAEFVHQGLIASLPPGVPLSGEIVSAKFTGKEKAIATLAMFDGLTGKVEVSKWTTNYPDAWATQWLDTGNPPCYWAGSRWV